MTSPTSSNTAAGQTAEITRVAKSAKAASGKLARLSESARNQALLNIARALVDKQDEILAANRKDLEAAQKKLDEGKLSAALFGRLKLDQAKLRSVASGIEQLAALDDPIGKVELRRELDEGLELTRMTAPIGVIGVVFEARPDALPQIATLCLKSGNAVILKGGSEAENSNRVIFNCLKEAAIDAGVPADTMHLLESRSHFKELLSADQYVDLIVPRGSGELIREIQNSTRIPVLGHAEGICHLYIDSAASLDKALKLAVDAKVQYPSACNTIETMLVHDSVAKEFIPKVFVALKDQGVEIRADSASKKLAPGADVLDALESDWSTEYSDLIISVKLVSSIDEAIDHINSFSSAHTDAIVTENRETAERFCDEVNSAGVFVNASTRFADGFRYGFGAEVGISTNKLHPRGPVGMEGLVTYKYRLMGKGHIVADYVGNDAKSFTHKDLK